MNWNTVIGRQQIVGALQAALAENRVAHAYLFFGLEGIGKKTVADALAAALVCENRTANACGTCSACRNPSHPDIRHIRPEGKSLKIDQIRDVKKQAYLKPRQAARQVFIIEEADTMTADAANSLLKVLEEPPAATVFILLAASPAALLPTVVSRCQPFSVPRLSDQEILQVLQAAGIPCNPGDPLIAAAEGIPGRALRLAGADYAGFYRQAVQLITSLAEGESPSALSALLEESESTDKIVDTMVTVLRDLLILQHAPHEGLLCLVPDRAVLMQLAELWPPAAGPQALEVMTALQNDLNNPVNVRLALERALRRLKEVLLDADSCRYSL